MIANIHKVLFTTFLGQKTRYKSEYLNLTKFVGGVKNMYRV